MKSVYFIEWLDPVRDIWNIAHSYDYSFFVSREDAEEFLKANRDAVPTLRTRICEYVRTVNR